MPSAKIGAAIFERIHDLPDSFMSFAVEELRDYASLPTNLGREIRIVLWPTYLEKNPQLRARTDNGGCDACRRSAAGAGFFYVRAPGGKRDALIKCVCNKLPNVAHWKAWSIMDMHTAGIIPDLRGQ